MESRIEQIHGLWAGTSGRYMSKEISVVISDGRVYTNGKNGGLGRPVFMDERGYLRFAGCGYSFSPAAGEIERIGGANLFSTF